MSWMTTVVAIVTAIPKIKAMWDNLIDFYIDQEIAKIKIQEVSESDERKAMFKAISNAETDADIIALSSGLRKLNGVQR